MIGEIIDFFLHLDKHLSRIIAEYGAWTYGLIFATIFCETGLVVTPFLPGDSLLFAAGALAAGGALNAHYLFAFLSVAGILGNSTNYAIGHYVGPRVFAGRHRLLNPKQLDRARVFYQKYGGRAVVIGRFLPILRTLVPFVAGIGAMTYPRYMLFNVIGSMLWVGTFVYLGYFFGNLPFVKHNFSLVILAVIVISISPPVIEAFRHRARGGKGQNR